MAVPGLGSSLFQTELDILSNFTALPAPVRLIARSAMVRPCEPIPPCCLTSTTPAAISLH